LALRAASSFDDVTSNRSISLALLGGVRAIRIRTRLAVIALAWLALGSTVYAAHKDAAPIVKVAAGTLAGATDGTVERFLNIPLAALPTNQLRWRAPQPLPLWKGVRDASKMGPACPRPVRPALVAGGVADNQSEDCLQLNIWRPKGSKELAVMVWLHGGAHMRDKLTDYGAIADSGRVVRDGNVITGGGVTAGIDFALSCAADIAGDLVAQAIQLLIEYAPAPPFDAGRPETASPAVMRAFHDLVAARVE
jgi:hypothetical protein